MYGLGVLTLEKLDYDMSLLGLMEKKVICDQVMTALSYFDKVIANDTSRRGDTTGLAHRSCAVTILQHFKVITLPVIKKININEATFKEVLTIVYLDYELTKKIFNYRDEVAELQEISELKNIVDFPMDKYDRIVLYLIAK